MNIPNYIKEAIDQEIESLIFEENKEYQEYRSIENALENLEKIIKELKNPNNQNINFTLSKLINNKIIRDLEICNINTTPVTLSEDFKNKTLDEQIQILESLHRTELEKFKKIKKPNEKIKKLDNELKEITKNLKNKFEKIPDFIKNSNQYNKDTNNSNEIKEYIFNEKYVQGIFEIICYYIQPSQLFDNLKNENCLHSEIRDYIIKQLNQKIENLNLEKIIFGNDSENLKVIVIESKQEIDQENQEIIDSILAFLSSKGFEYDSNYIQEVFFNWSKIFLNSNFSDIQNLIEKIFSEENQNLNPKEFLDFLGSLEFKFICDNLDSSVGVCQIIHNKVDQNQIENHKCNQECLINQEINDFYKNYLARNINFFIENYNEKKNILIKQIILGKIYDLIQKNLNLLNIFLLINNTVRENFEEKIIQNNFKNIQDLFKKSFIVFGFDFFEQIRQQALNNYISELTQKLNNTNIFQNRFQEIDILNKKFNINLYILLKNNLKEFREILNNTDQNQLKNFLKEKVLTKKIFDEKILNNTKKCKKLILFNLKKIFICFVIYSILLLKILILYFIYLISKLLFELSCLISHYFLKFVNQNINLLNSFQKILVNLRKIFQIFLITLTFLYILPILGFLFKINEKINNSYKILEKKFDILKEKIFSKEEIKKTENLYIFNSVIFFIYKVFLNFLIYDFILYTYFNLILNYNKNIDPIIEKLLQIQNLYEIKDFLKFENFISPVFKLYLIIFFIAFVIEIIYIITQFFIELYNTLNINEYKYEDIIDKINNSILELSEIKGDEINSLYEKAN